jgi:hypothetical protein
MNSRKYDLLYKLGIKQILSVGKELLPHRFNGPVYKINIDDNESEDISKYFNQCIEFIKKAPTVVHCRMGISRSTSVVIAYLMKEKNMTLAEALNHVRRIRPHVCPNVGFMKQLETYEKEIGKVGKVLFRHKDMSNIGIVGINVYKSFNFYDYLGDNFEI